LSGGSDCSEDDVAANAARKASQLHKFEWSTQQRESFKHRPRDSRDDELLFRCSLDWQGRREREDTQSRVDS